MKSTVPTQLFGRSASALRNRELTNQGKSTPLLSQKHNLLDNYNGLIIFSVIQNLARQNK